MPTLNKLEYLDETKGQIKNALNTKFNSGITDNDTFRSYVSKIKDIYTNWTKVTGESTALSLTLTKKGLIKLNLKGNTSQETSPSPDYPQQIHTISGDNEVKIQNKNLLNRETCEENKALIWTTGGITTSDNSISSDYMRAGAKQSFSTNYNCNVFAYTKDKTYIGNLSAGNTLTKTSNSNATFLNFTLPNDNSIYYIRIEYRTAVNSGVDLLNSNIMVNYGTTLLSYTPHQEQNFPISLGDLEYCKIGNYEDLFFKNVVGSTYYDSTLELNKWYLKKNVNKANETIFATTLKVTSTIGNDLYAYACSVNNLKHDYISTGAVISNLFAPKKLGTAQETSDVENVRFNMGIAKHSSSSSNQIVISLLKTYLSDAETTTFKTFLSNNNFEFYYVLENPTDTLLNNTLQTQLDNIYYNAMSYQGQTNVSQENDDLPFVISASALMKGGN